MKKNSIKSGTMPLITKSLGGGGWRRSGGGWGRHDVRH